MDFADCGHLDVDGESDDLDYGADDAAGLRVFTVRGLVAMFAVLSGVAALLLVAYVIKLLLKLQESGNLDARNAIAHTAKVYITIPAVRPLR